MKLISKIKEKTCINRYCYENISKDYQKNHEEYLKRGMEAYAEECKKCRNKNCSKKIL